MKELLKKLWINLVAYAIVTIICMFILASTIAVVQFWFNLAFKMLGL